MYHLNNNSGINNKNKQYKKLVFVSNSNTKVQFAYFEKSKYNAYMQLAYKDNSFVWQR